MVQYSSAAIYVDSQTSVQAKIIALDAIIDALLTTCMKAVENGDLTEYYLDSGQTKITAKYRNPIEVANAVTAYQKIKNMYVSQMNGRQVRQLPEQNFRFRRPCN